MIYFVALTGDDGAAGNILYIRGGEYILTQAVYILCGILLSAQP